MQDTKIVSPTPQNINFAANLVKDGQIVAIPTETVYGLAANALDQNAVAKIYKAKGRPSDNPLIVHICDFSHVFSVAREVSPVALKLMQKFWPGPLTVVLPKKECVPDIVTGNLDTVAVRMPNHQVAMDIIKQSQYPLAAPSANSSGKPSPTKACHVYDDLKGKIPLIVDGGDCDIGIESTVVKIDGSAVTILRPGIISIDTLKTVTEDVSYSKDLENKNFNYKAESPGMMYKHYSPEAQVILIESSFEKFCEYLVAHKTNNSIAIVFNGEQKQIDISAVTYGDENDFHTLAKNLFNSLRNCDKMGADKIFIRCPDSSGTGYAIYDRLLRAAGFKKIIITGDEF